MVVPEASILCGPNTTHSPDRMAGMADGEVISYCAEIKIPGHFFHLRYYKNVLAENGEAGSGNNSTGRFGKDIYIDVPLGTIARDEISGLKEAEILEDGQEIIWLKGGRGGLGNARFATPTNQAPEHAQPGEAGVEGWKVLELKVLADVGLVGFPNAGKSTLLSVMTAATPKIADYAFTTLTPQLGMVDYRDGKSFCIADLPGIIEGAAEGKGLGHRFLRHIESNVAFLFMIPADSPDHEKNLKYYAMNWNSIIRNCWTNDLSLPSARAISSMKN